MACLNNHSCLLLLPPPPLSKPYFFSPSLTSVPLPITSSSFPSLPRSSKPRSLSWKPPTHLLCKAAEYVFPDPIPEFAESEADKFRRYLLEKLSKKKKGIFGDSLEEVVRVCTEILNNFLHTEYGGPGTLLVIPFIDMADTLNERGLPGGPQAARAAVVWAQKHVDKDWNAWTSGEGGSDHDNEPE
ncbi:protein PLASTID REDOX INSENSITIVE 2-like [Iris pallida]|uniref:Protein PLASTID REDOX INSENSITIVE 2-like n=1 Tax=Iris pallida TaxID=29817 RepID=A0AAX6GSI2_IRIPA|nr:protein PLASTID REDOX INSENSITIVE 2-like [Iris pallida]